MEAERTVLCKSPQKIITSSTGCFTDLQEPWSHLIRESIVLSQVFCHNVLIPTSFKLVTYIRWNKSTIQRMYIINQTPSLEKFRITPVKLLSTSFKTILLSFL